MIRAVDVTQSTSQILLIMVSRNKGKAVQDSLVELSLFHRYHLVTRMM